MVSGLARIAIGRAGGEGGFNLFIIIIYNYQIQLNGFEKLASLLVGKKIIKILAQSDVVGD